MTDLFTNTLADLVAVQSALGLPTSYVGQVATRSFIPRAFASANKQFNCRSVHIASDRINSLQVAWANWYANSTIESGTGAAATITASVEYPAGTFTPMTFSGVAQGTMANGDTLFSDACAVGIPAGAKFWIRAFYQCSAGIPFVACGTVPVMTDQMEFAASGLTDKTLGGTITSSNWSIWTPPVAIIGTTNRPSVFIAGDSRQAGVNDGMNDATGDIGQVARAIGPMAAYINAGCPAERISSAQSNYAKRAALAVRCSHVVDGYGINDISTASAAAIATARTTFAALLGGKPTIGLTLTPKTTSSDSWATTTNQTVTADEAVRTAFNDLCRAGITGEKCCVDVADVVESARNSGKWIVSNIPGATTGTANYATTDGIHETPMVNATVALSRRIVPWLFSR